MLSRTACLCLCVCLVTSWLAPAGAAATSVSESEAPSSTPDRRSWQGTVAPPDAKASLLKLLGNPEGGVKWFFDDVFGKRPHHFQVGEDFKEECASNEVTDLPTTVRMWCKTRPATATCKTRPATVLQHASRGILTLGRSCIAHAVFVWRAGSAAAAATTLFITSQWPCMRSMLTMQVFVTVQLP